PRRGRSESHRYRPLCARAASNVCWGSLALCRHPTRARLVVVCRAPDPIVSGLVVAAFGRGENSVTGASWLYRIYTESESPPYSTRVVTIGPRSAYRVLGSDRTVMEGFP